MATRRGGTPTRTVTAPRLTQAPGRGGAARTAPRPASAGGGGGRGK